MQITFRQYAEKWLDTKTPSETARKELGRRLRLHTYPVLGSRPVGTFRQEHIREFLAVLEAKPGIGPSYTRNIFADVQSVLSAAVDDSLLSRNPCGAQSIRRPRPDEHPVVPWVPAQVFAVRAALLERYQAMVDVGAGCGLRQGEVFGLAEDAIDADGRTLHVVRQIKHVDLPFCAGQGPFVRENPLKFLNSALTAETAGHPPFTQEARHPRGAASGDFERTVAPWLPASSWWRS